MAGRRKDRGGREVTVDWSGRAVRAWVPDPLTERDLDLSPATVRRTEQAAAAAQRASDALPARWEPLARLLLRAEGLASSAIEGLAAPLADVAAAELDPIDGEPSAWVADNLAVVTMALADRHHRLTPSRLNAWHRALMAGSSHLPADTIGRLRRVQGWIGGTSPLDAALVTAPPDELRGLVADLVSFTNRSDVDAVTQAAIAHAQFETIHPYADGNGRIGRVLMGWLLTRRLELATPPPVSVRIAADRGGYLAGLTTYRMGRTDPWVRWFADVLQEAADATTNLVHATGELQARWTARLDGLRVDAAARRLVDVLPEHPVLTATVAGEALGVSTRAGRTALAALAEHDIVAPFSHGRAAKGHPQHWWVATELVDLVTAWSRPG